jgi:hypothetical protein
MRAEAELGPRAESSPITQSSRDRTWRPHHGIAGGMNMIYRAEDKNI